MTRQGGVGADSCYVLNLSSTVPQRLSVARLGAGVQRPRRAAFLPAHAGSSWVAAWVFAGCHQISSTAKAIGGGTVRRAAQRHHVVTFCARLAAVRSPCIQQLAPLL